MGLKRSDIQNEIDKAHVKIDELTTIIAKRYSRSQKYKSIAYTVFKGINYIKILQHDENLTDKEVEIFIQALRETLSLHEIAYQPTTLSFNYNQPAINITNVLEVSGTSGYIPRYATSGTTFENSKLIQSGSSLILDGSTFILGGTTAAATGRVIEAVGATPVNLTIKTLGDLKLIGNVITTDNPLVLGQTLSFANDTTSIETIKDDGTFATPSTSALSTEAAISTKIAAEVATLNNTITNTTKSTGSGLSATGNVFRAGGSTTQNAIFALGAGVTFGVTSSGANMQVVQGTSATISGPSGGLVSNATDFYLSGILDYDQSYAGSFTALSLTDKTYQDSHIGSQGVSATVKAPGVGQNDYSIVWDNSAGVYTLKSIGSGGSVGDADTLDGIDSSQFLRSDVADTMEAKLTFDLTSFSSTAGKSPIDITLSSDNTYARLNVSTDGAGTAAGFEFYAADNSDYAEVKANTFTSTETTGTAPLTVASLTMVTNLNAEYLQGVAPSQTQVPQSIVQRTSSNSISVSKIEGITNTDRVVNLNADMLDGIHAADFIRSDALAELDQSLRFADGVKLYFGNPDGLSAYHSTSSYLKLEDNNPLYIINQSSQSIARFTNSIAELYYQGSKKLETYTGGIIITGTVTADNFIDSSDRKLKKIKGPIEDTSLRLFEFIRPVRYTLKSDGNDRLQYGVIAQELEELYPTLVIEDAGHKSVDYRSLYMIAIKKIQEMDMRLKALEADGK